MQTALDLNDISAKFAAALVESTYQKIVRGLTRSALTSALSMQNNLADYASREIARFSYVRTIVSDTPSSLLQIYQPTRFAKGDEKFTEEEFVSFLNVFNRVSIRGHAGAGKSLFLRRHFLRVLDQSKTIPLLFDLRVLNTAYSGLMERLHKHACQLMPWMEYEIFRSLLKAGKIDLMLDGLDEVGHSIRPSVNADIGVLSREFPKCRMLVTTRYGDRYATPGSIDEFHVEPFSKQQAVSLVRSLDFPDENKQKFADALEDNLYDRSPDLLSNPLLCSIMLLTYKRFADVPPELHLYYQQAYEVLFSRHDASKDEGYKRDFLSPVNVAEMQSILSYFSAITYASDAFEFSENECLRLLSEAAEYSRVTAKAEHLKDDLVEAVSLLTREGVELKFVHRSFQEYFTAYYISKAGLETTRACVDAVKTRDDTDSVVPMSIALNENHFIEAWLLPTLKDDIEKLEADFNSGRYFSVVRSTLPMLTIEEEDLYLSAGVGARSKSFGIYLRVSRWPHNKVIFKKGDVLDSKNTLPVAFRNLTKNVPVPEGFREAIGKSGNAIDLEDRNLAPLGELPIWQPIARTILAIMRGWLREFEARKRAQEASPLEAFRRAAATRGRVDGEISGPVVVIKS